MPKNSALRRRCAWVNFGTAQHVTFPSELTGPSMTERDLAADIRQVREQSNAAIAARDAVWVVSYMADTIRVRVAGGPELVGRDANADAFAEQFADAAFAGYVRTTVKIDVADSGMRASEHGTWVGRWRAKSGMHIQRGSYTAEWELTPLGWQIVGEVYRER
jgi:ketosteroid isomerase-like protein